jgi:hypothetical protein
MIVESSKSATVKTDNLNRQPPIGNRQSATANRQPPIGNCQSATANRQSQSATANRQSQSPSFIGNRQSAIGNS